MKSENFRKLYAKYINVLYCLGLFEFFPMHQYAEVLLQDCLYRHRSRFYVRQAVMVAQ